jgi:TonB-linked SusC/RagA family outer membrane protein
MVSSLIVKSNKIMKIKRKLTCNIFRKLSLLALYCTMSAAIMAQAKTISGVVTSSEDGEKLIGVTVLVKGTSTGTVTNLDGKYTLTTKGDVSALVFSMVGMKTTQVNIGNKTVVNLTMEPDSKSLDQIVVTGYSKQKKADLTGAVTVVDVDELKKVTSNNPIQALQGRAPGVNITTDGSPSGSGTTVRIRGIGSINSNIDPLYVIDGIATQGGMHEMNPNDIESIQVLKDASAASIYGSKAANGVIIITTKKAKEGQLQVNFGARASMSWYDSKIPMLNTQEYGQAMWQAKINSGDKNPDGSGYGYSFITGQNADGTPKLLQVLDPTAVYLDNDPTKSYFHTMKIANTDWFNQITQNALSQSYDLSVLRGTNKGNTMFSLNYTNNDGIIKTTNFERFSARINSDTKLINDKLVIGENLTLNKTGEVQDPGVMDLTFQTLPIIPVHTIDGIGWGGPVAGMNDRQNPVRLLDDNKQNKYDYMRLFGNVYADLELIKNLHLRSSFGIDYSDFFKRSMQLVYSSGYLSNDQNGVNNNQGHSVKWTWSNTLNYQKTIGKNAIDVLLGTEMYKQHDESFWAQRLGTGSYVSEDPNYMYLDAGTGTMSLGGGAAENTLLSYFGKANYVYDQKYLASVTVRRDGSSRFGKNNQFGTFPAFSLGWRINQENFMKDISAISDLKLRAGWGQTGNQEISNTGTRSIYVTDYTGNNPTWDPSTSTAYDISGGKTGSLPSGYRITQRGNDNLKWETSTQTNIGLDFGFFNQKLYGSVDYFIKDTKDCLINPPYLAAIGEGGNHWVNGASIQNKGLEVLVGYRDKIGSDFNYEITGNAGTYKNVVTSLPAEVVNNYGGNGTTDNILGHALGTYYGYVADGLFKTQDEVNNSAEQSGKGLGRIRYRDINSDGSINDKDRTWIGNPNPDFTYGLNLNMEYKGFNLTLFFQGVGRVDLNDYAVKSFTDFWSVRETGSNKGVRLLNAWTPTNSNSTIPALTSTDSNNESRFSTYYIENGAYSKLKNAEIGYTLPKQTLKLIGVSRLQIYVSGQNLLALKSSNFTGIDPERPDFAYPLPVTFTTGINVTF